MAWKEVEGNLITLAKEGQFDVVAHGCNCFCVMGAGIAPIMARAFGCDEFPMEHDDYRGDINKLGTIDYQLAYNNGNPITAVNAYTQFSYGTNHKDGVTKPVDYQAIALCMRKMNHIFTGLHIGLPLIGCGLAGGDWSIVSQIMRTELKDCDVTIVHFKASENGAEVRKVSNGNSGEQ